MYKTSKLFLGYEKLLCISLVLFINLSCTSGSMRHRQSKLLEADNNHQSSLTLSSANQAEQHLHGKVIKIFDGDTYELLTADNQRFRIRMEGIDAPEGGMPFYRVSKNYLTELCAGKMVEIKIKEKDHYGRYVAFTFLEDGRELSHEMVKAGLAWHYKQYNDDQSLADLEIEAREAKRGLWRDKNPMAPWTARKLRRQGVSTKDSFNITVERQ